MTHDSDIAAALPQAFGKCRVHPHPDSCIRFSTLGQERRILLPRGVQLRKAPHDLGKGQAVPRAHALFLKALDHDRISTQRQGGFPGTDEGTAEDLVHASQFRHKGQQRRLKLSQLSQRNVRFAADAPALPDRDIRHGVADQIEFSHFSSSPK